MRKGIPILNKHKEKEHADEYRSGEVKEYRMTKKEIQDRYGNVAKAEKKDNVELTYRWANLEGGKKVKINKELVRLELEEGLTKEEICKKYAAHTRVVGMLIGKLEKEGVKVNKASKESIQVVEEIKESSLKVLTKQLDLQGELLKYRVQDGQISIIKENLAIRIDNNQIDRVIQELQEVRCIVKGA